MSGSGRNADADNEDNLSPFDKQVDSFIERTDKGGPATGDDDGDTSQESGDKQQRDEGDAEFDRNPLLPSDSRRKQQQPPKQAGRDQSRDKQDADKDGGKASRQQQQTTTQRTVRADAAGNLVDGQGQVVARAGQERRLYETAVNARNGEARVRGELDTSNAKVHELETALQAYQHAAQSYTSLGLKPDQVTTALQLMSNWIKNPVATIKYMLTETQAAGHDISTLTGGGFDPEALGKMLDARLQPITSRLEEEKRYAEASSAAANTWNGFVSAHPDAATHEEILADMLAKDKNLSLDGAFWRLHSWAVVNNLDFSQPLRLQVEQRATDEGNKDNKTRRGNTPANPRSVPPVARNQSATENMTDFRLPRVAHDMANRDLVADTLKEFGLKVE